MKAVNAFFRIVVGLMFITGFALILNSRFNKETSHSSVDEIPAKSLTLKNYLLKYQKPQRIEIVGLSKKFADDIEEIKKLKVAQDPNSDFYVTIQLFSDEGDKSAPLIAQIKFIDLKTDNLRKEESINLE